MKPLRSKVLLRYTLSYLLLLVMIALCIAFSMQILNGATGQIITEGNRLALTQYKGVVDAHFEMLVKISELFSLNETVRTQMRRGSALSVSDRYDMMELSHTLATVKQTYSYSLINDLFLYFPASGSVITAGARAEAELFFRDLYRFEGYSPRQSMELLKGSWRSKYLVLKDIPCEKTETGRSYYAIARTLDRGAREAAAVLVFLTERGRFEQLLGELGMSDQCEIYLCDTEGRALFSSEEDRRLAQSTASITLGSDAFDAQYRLVSNYPGLAYVIQGAERQVSLVLLFGIPATLLAAILLAYANYRPIRQLWQQTRSPEKAERGAFRNELQDIHANINAILRENTRHKRRMKDLLPVYAEKLLLDYIHGSVNDEKMNWELLRDDGIRLDGPGLMILMLRLDSGISAQGTDRKAGEALMDEVAAVAEQVFASLGCCFALREEDTGYLLLNLAQGAGQGDARRVASELQGVLLREKKVEVTFALGPQVSSRQELWISRAQAQRAMETVYGGQPMRVVCAWELSEAGHPQQDPLQDYDTRLVNHLRSGNVDQVMALLDEIFDGGKGSPSLSYGDVECAMLHVLDLCLCTAGQMGVSLEEERKEYGGWVERLQRFRHLSQFKECVRALAQRMALETDKNQDPKLQKTVVGYVEEHYDDSNLNVSMIADTLGVSQSWLSTHFKRQTGVNASDYIHLVRIRHAKKAMEDTSLSLNQIAKQVGYISDATFIRSFKKYEGVTPGAYRREWCREDDPIMGR